MRCPVITRKDGKRSPKEVYPLPILDEWWSDGHWTMVSSSHDPAMLSPGGGPLIDHESRITSSSSYESRGTNKVPEFVT